MRRIHRSDAVQDEIVEGLRKAGYRVEIIGRPVDLLVGKTTFSGSFGQAVPTTRWTILEVKTCTKSGARRNRKDQAAQSDFIAMTGTPVVTSLTQALRAVQEL